MHDFSPWLRKELLEGARSYRFLIIGFALAFFALLDPVMLKLLPLIMKSQVGADLSALFPASRDYAFQTFRKDLFQILSLVLCLCLGGLLAKERKARAFVIPVSKGADFAGIVPAKFLAYAAYLPLIIFPGALVSYAYAGLLFPGQGWDLAMPLAAAWRFSLYFAWLLSFVILSSAIAPSGVAASLLSLGAAFGLPALASLLGLERYSPSWLALAPQGATPSYFPDSLPAALIAVAAAVLNLACAVLAMKRAKLY